MNIKTPLKITAFQKEEVTEYKNYITIAIDLLFTDCNGRNKIGFWDPIDRRIIKKLDFIGGNLWKADKAIEYRYGPFALMGVLYCRLSNFKFARPYDTKVHEYLHFLISKIQKDGQLDADSSGWNHALVLTCLCVGYLNFKKEHPKEADRYLSNALKVYEYCSRVWKHDTISNNHDLFLLWAYTWLYDALKSAQRYRECSQIKKEIEIFADWLCQIQDKKGIFQTGDPKAHFHQRMMYPLWGLGRAAKILDKKLYLSAIERTLDYVLCSRCEKDGAFIWYPPNMKNRIIAFLMPKASKNLFFECHQTFFVNSVEQYYVGNGTNNKYLADEISAMNWIFKTNRRKVNLARECNLGVPWRVMDSNGKIDIKGQKFKGSYEVGSYIMALTDIIKRIEKKL
ncbi:MAG: hypothetical protein ACTSUT_11920 [Promethearchaeota archaeon]